jgi:hypothetical protein
MLYSFDVLHFEENAEKLVKIVVEKAVFFNALRVDPLSKTRIVVK